MKIAVIGLGAIGAQVLWHLSRTPGVEAHGFESAYPGHPEAGAGGESRLFRTVELDDPAYEPVIARADRLWEELQAAAGRTLRTTTGVLLSGKADSPQMQRALQSGKRSSADCRVLKASEIRARFPQFRVAEEDIGIWDSGGGVIRPELTVATTAELARRGGAAVRSFTRVTGLRSAHGGIELDTASGSFVFDRVVTACGGWTTRLLPQLRERIVARRLTSAWFHARDDGYLKTMVPFMRTAPDYCYGIPSPGMLTLKLGLGFNDHLPAPDPDTVPRSPGPGERERFGWIIRDLLPGLDPMPMRMSTYIESYTTSMHDHIAFDEEVPGLLVLGGFSGHGFKVAPAIGEIGAQLAARGTSDIDVGFLREARDVFRITDPATGATTHNEIVASRPRPSPLPSTDHTSAPLPDRRSTP